MISGMTKSARVLSGAALLTLVAGTASAQVAWRSGAEARIERMDQNTAQMALDSLAARKQARRVVIQFGEPITPQRRAALEEAGVRLLSSLGNHAYFANVAEEARTDRAMNAATVISVRAIERQWKLHRAYEAGDIPPFAIVDAAGDSGDGSDPIVAAYVMFHRDVDLAVAERLVAGYDAFVRDSLETANSLVIELPASQIKSLAEDDSVQWLEPPLPKWDSMNDSNRSLVQADTLHTAPYNLNGFGIKVMVYDGGTVLSSHEDFQDLLQGNRAIVRDSAGLSTHATHVAGTIAGDGSASGGTYKGMAPAARVESYGFEYSGSDVFLYQNPGDLESDYNEAINTYNCDISNNSIGSNIAQNFFDCAYEGDYGVCSTVIDSIVGGSLGDPFRIVWAGGNERGNGRCGTGFETVPPPSTAKNHCSVGALNSNDDSITSFTSWGPTDDGRMKPDVSAPGCQSNDDGGVTSASTSGGYTTFCGTSMASPTVCGIGTLLLQDFRAQFPGQPDFRNSTLRALLAHNAADIDDFGPDYRTGYGSVRAHDTVDFLRTGNFLEAAVGQGGAFVAAVTVDPGDPELKITIAWDDVPGVPNTSPALVNDLDLVVRDPLGTQHHVWTLNPGSPDDPAVRTQANHLDNIEQVFVSSPMAGEWSVEIVGFDVPEGPQSFSVTSSGALTAMSIALDSALPTLVAPGDPTTLTVSIDTLNQSVVGGSETFSYRFDGGAFTTVALTPLGGGEYEATLPAANCDDTPEFYFSASGSVTGAATDPPGAPASTYGLTVGEETVAFEDDMEADNGWTLGVAGDDATTGVWTRVDPNGTTAQPEDDHTSGMAFDCYVTGQGSIGGGVGENDVDGGSTTLVTPVIDLSGGDATISYWRWYSNNAGASPGADTFVIDISNNGGGSWTNVETLGPTGPDTIGGWNFHSFTVSDFVAPTGNVQMRFIASDLADGSIVEAAIDDFFVSSVDCTPVVPTCIADVDSSGTVDFDDLNVILANWAASGATFAQGDVTGDGNVNFDDLNALLLEWGMLCN